MLRFLTSIMVYMYRVLNWISQKVSLWPFRRKETCRTEYFFRRKEVPLKHQFRFSLLVLELFEKRQFCT